MFQGFFQLQVVFHLAGKPLSLIFEGFVFGVEAFILPADLLQEFVDLGFIEAADFFSRELSLIDIKWRNTHEMASYIFSMSTILLVFVPRTLFFTRKQLASLVNS